MNVEYGLDLSLPREFLKPAVLSSLLTAGALAGLYAYLNRYTRKRYFTIWMVAWLFYATWLLSYLVLPSIDVTAVVEISRQCALGVAAVFLLWGSAEFLEQRASQRMMGLFLTFVLVWSTLGVFHSDDPLVAQIPVFGLLGVASVVTAGSFLRFRRQFHYVGAGLLAFGFLLWGLFFMILPKLLNDPHAVSACFIILAMLQLFVAVSMIVLVLEEVRSDVVATHQRFEEKKTETKRLHARVRSSEERYKTLFEQASEAIVIAAGEQLHLEELNAAARRLLGIDGLQARQSRLTSFISFPGQAPERATIGAWLELFSQQHHLTLVRKDGAKATVEIQAAPVEFDHRPAIQFVLREVTERVRLEQQLRQAEKLSALGQMISGVAHELNNPLAAVQGYLELILARQDLPAQARAGLEKVAAESGRASKLVSQFLAFARAQPPRREPVDLNELVRQSVALREFDFRVASVELKLDLAANLPRTLLDPDQVQQALLNLVNNALQVLCEKSAPRRITIQTAATDKDLRLTVADNGPGVPPHLVSRIFEPFFTTKEVGAGTGLGLSVVHSVMTDHQGRVAYENAPGGGAMFVLTFPLVAVPPGARSAAGLPQAAPLGADAFRGRRVLVLDDEPSIAELLCEMLGMLGCETRVATAGAQALAELGRCDFDVILSDFRMPGMNGQQFYESVRAVNPRAARRIIFLTGDVVNEQTQSFLQSTGNLHLPKPFNLSAVQEAMNAVLEGTAS